MSIKTMRLAPIVVALTLSACTVVPYEQARPDYKKPAPGLSTKTPQPQEALVVPTRPSPQASAAPAKARSLPAAQRMRQLASAEGEKGEYKRAIALLERALRISPRDPETYYELARNHLLMDNPSQALQLAQRGLSHNPSADQRRRLNQLIEDCKARLTA
ncbi:MAG: tetratricopeptide repeat protein [Granulosicoccaceae bacterium]